MSGPRDFHREKFMLAPTGLGGGGRGESHSHVLRVHLQLPRRGDEKDSWAPTSGLTPTPRRRPRSRGAGARGGGQRASQGAFHLPAPAKQQLHQHLAPREALPGPRSDAWLLAERRGPGPANGTSAPDLKPNLL